MPCHWEVCLVISVVQESNCQVWRCFPKRSVNVPSHKSWTLGWSEALLGPFKKCFSPPKFLPSPPNVMKKAALFSDISFQHLSQLSLCYSMHSSIGSANKTETKDKMCAFTERLSWHLHLCGSLLWMQLT